MEYDRQALHFCRQCLIDSLNSDVSGVDTNDTADKPVYLSEMGVTNPDSGTNPPINSYAYGLDMFDYGIQAALGGEASAMAWCVDGFDYNKNCGMWDISGLNGGTTLRPWFYSWSLLNRYFPSNATIYRMNAPANVRVVAASVPAGTKDHWSFALVNQNTTDQSVTLQVPGWGSGNFNEYVYSSGGNAADGNGFPVPTTQISTASGGLTQGLTVDVPAGSGVVLTTLDGSPLAQASGVTITDNLTSWNNVYSHTANLTFDASNPDYFALDASRVKRTSNTAETIVWHRFGVSTFSANVEFCCTSQFQGTVTIETSPDGTTWTTLPTVSSTPVNTGNGGA